jgi:hypothetical protein
MATISSEGAAQEQRVLSDLGTTYALRLGKRGVSPEKLKTYADLEADMESKRTEALGTDSSKRELSGQEAGKRQELYALIRPIQEAAKKTFPKGDPRLKEFHVGDASSDSTSLLLAWASDVAAAATKYLDLLSSKGLVQADIDALKSVAAELKQTDTRQETAKTKARPEATAAFNASVKALIECADSIHTAAGLEFAKEPAIKAQFDAAKKLRYEPSVKKNGGGNVPPQAPTGPTK